MTKTKRLVRIFASLLAAMIMVAAMLCVAPLEINAAEDNTPKYIGTVINSGIPVLTAGGGYKFFTDASCTVENISVGGSHEITDQGYKVYLKANDGYTIDEVDVKYVSGGSAGDFVTQTDGVYCINIPAGTVLSEHLAIYVDVSLTSTALLDVNAALLQWKSKGQSGTLSFTLNEQKYTIRDATTYDEVYTKVFDLLWAQAKSYENITTAKTLTSGTYIWKVSGTSNTLTKNLIIQGATVIFLTEENATIKASNTGKITLAGGALFIQGKSADAVLTFDGENKTRNLNTIGSDVGSAAAINHASRENLIQIRYGHAYFEYARLYQVKSSNKAGTGTQGGALQLLPLKGNSSLTYLYVSDLEFYKCTASSGGAFGGNSTYQGSEIYFYNAQFHECQGTANGLNNAGGGAIRAGSGAGYYTFQSCKFFSNSVGVGGSSGHKGYDGGAAVRWNIGANNVYTGIFNGCTFDGNTSGDRGGAILTTGGLQLNSCVLSNNTATHSGGAVFVGTHSQITSGSTDNMDGSVVFGPGTEIFGNMVTKTTNDGTIDNGGIGGAIHFLVAPSRVGNGDNAPVRAKYDLVAYVRGAEIYGNEALNGGAIAISVLHDYICGVYVYEGSIMDNNTAKKLGGAVYIESKDVYDNNKGFNIEGGTVSNNEAQQNGGAVYLQQGNVTVSGGTIQKNRATGNGGAFYLKQGSVDISAGMLMNNFAGNHGGAAYLENGTVDISGGTLSQNEATANGGVAYLAGGKVSVQGTALITQNTAQNGGAAYLAGTGSMSISGGTLTTNTAAVNGGAAYLAGGTLEISGTATITANQAQNGGAAYLANGTVTVSGGTLSNNQATENGGAAYLGGGTLTIEDGTLSENKAISGNGGAAYVQGGDFIINGGTVTACTAAQKGGAVYVSGGDANVNGGTLTGCSANEGGAIYVEGGTVTMLGGQITDNHALAGNGGAIYVTGNTELSVKVQSGEISGNTATGNGGAICVVGKKDQTNAITVQIGVNKLHYDANGNAAVPPCDHNGNNIDDDTCPVVKNNTCTQEGGAIYITGTNQTNLNIYCITESGNRGDGREADSEKTGLSDFLKVDGGNVLISAETSDPNAPADQKIYYGNSVINSSVHVTGGNLTVSGTLSNPAIFAPITVDVVESGGSYTDQRENDKRKEQTQYYVVRYFENFKAEGSDRETGQYTVHQTPTSVPHTVWGVIYNHTGKTIVGWNTQQDGKGETFGVSTVVEYEYFQKFIPDNSVTLSLYAIWADNFYWIQFDPNTESFSGSMSKDDNKISFLCAAENAPLPENQFVNRSYKFLGWATSPSGDKMYDDQQLLEKALTQEVGKIITFYAVWEICDHKNETKFVFAKVDDSSMSCTCECAYVVTATIVAPTGARFDEQEHPVSFAFTDDNNGDFSAGDIPDFQDVTFQYALRSALTEPVQPINAGDYRATTTIGSVEIYIDYTIAKAYQTAPDKPTFTVKDNVLTINVPEKQQGDAETQIQYKLLHNDENGEVVTVGPKTDRVFSDFKSSWTLYYIVAFYPGNDNYLNSDEIASDQTYIFKGGVSITIINDTGIANTVIRETKKGDNVESVALVSTSSEGYYLSNRYGVMNVEGTLTNDDNQYASLNMSDPTTFGKYFVRNIDQNTKEFSYIVNSFAAGYKGEIKITFTGAKKKPTVAQSVAPNEHFGEISDITTEIAKDSAFTTYFHVEHYDSNVYSELKLSFGESLPKDTTIIMVDKASGSYWYTVLKNAADSIKVNELTQMGGTGEFPEITAQTKELKYQFIVDFSDVADHELHKLTLKLIADRLDEYAPELQATGKTVTLKPVSHALEAFTVTGTSATVPLQYAQGVQHASKWADREPTLVLSPKAGTVLPIDASIKVIETVGTQTKTTTATRDDQGNFAITLDPDATSLEIILQSQMFGEATYHFDVQLYAAYEGDAPMNGIPLMLAAKELTLQSQLKAQNAAKIAVNGNQRIFNLNDTITVNIEAKIAEGYTATVTLLKKNNQGGVYASTGHSKNLTTGENTFEISNLKESFGEGIFCVSVVIRDKANTAVLTVPYYLIIQDQSS